MRTEDWDCGYAESLRNTVMSRGAASIGLSRDATPTASSLSPSSAADALENTKRTGLAVEEDYAYSKSRRLEDVLTRPQISRGRAMPHLLSRSCASRRSHASEQSASSEKKSLTIRQGHRGTADTPSREPSSGSWMMRLGSHGANLHGPTKRSPMRKRNGRHYDRSSQEWFI
jgi:hypothetical protein